MSERLNFESLNNTRDLGGMRTADGRTVKPGRLIRSGMLRSGSEADLARLSDMIDVVVDFRTDQEIYEKPDPFITNVEYHHIPILSSWTAGVTWEVKEDFSEKQLFEELQKYPEKARQYLRGIYKGFVSNAYYVSQYRRFVKILLEDHDKAVLWHCTAGKDRAGFASVIAEELLGIDRQDIIADYLQTGLYIQEDLDRLTEALRMEYPDHGAVNDEAMGYLFGAKQTFIDAAYEKVEELYGTFDVFLKDALKVTKEERYRIREMYTE